MTVKLILAIVVILLIFLVFRIYLQLQETRNILRLIIAGPLRSTIRDESWVENETDEDINHDLDVYLGSKEDMCGYRNYYDNPCQSTPYYYYVD